MGHSVRPRRLGAEPFDLVFLVCPEVALEPEPLGLVVVVTLPREDVGAGAVQEPPVVRNHHRAAGELLEGVLQRAQGFDVEVVGGLVEQDEVSALLERQREVEPVALAAREHAGRLLLVWSLEPERRHVGPRRHLGLADDDVVQPVGDDLPDVLLRVDARAGLVDVAQLDGLADLDRAAVRLLETDDGLEQRGLSDAVGADDPDDAVARQGERQVLDEGASAEALVKVLDLDHHVAQPRTDRDLDLLEVELARLLGLGGHLLVALQPCLALGLARLGPGAHPRQLLGQPLLQLGVLAPLHREPFGLLLQVRGVVALVRVGPAAVEFQDPFGDVVQEVPVVGDRQDRARIRGEVLFEPLHALGVEVVGGLVEEQQVGLGQEQLAQRDAAALTAGQVGHRLVGRRAAQRVHGLLQLRVEVPRVGVVEFFLQPAHLLHQLVGVVGGHQLGDLVEAVELDLDLAQALFDVAANGLLLVQRRLLQQDADGRVVGQEGVTVVRLVQARHDPQDARLAGAVGPNDADLGAWIEAQRDVVQDHLVAVRLADLLHRVDELSHAAVVPFWSCGYRGDPRGPS
ncbi:30S ribosomal protein S5 [Mycobacterium sp. H4Y]|nr:30S ribosomal protein S5 [Mycobacterium sp. MOTT36Y]ELR84377.1 30S ribosomal protein S5 [Mycobacterium sp. H4Y]